MLPYSLYFMHTIMKSYQVLLLFFVFVMNTLTIKGIPASNVKFDFIQPDKTKLTITLKGDEYYNGYFTTDNVCIVNKGDGWYYAFVENGSILPSSLLAHDETDRSTEEIKFCGDNKELLLTAFTDIRTKIIERNNSISDCNQSKSNRSSNDSKISNLSGNNKGLVILIQYPNQTMQIQNPQKEFDMMYNQVGYSKNNHIGSVHDYFYEQSYGKFNITFDVVGPFTVSHNYEYYGEDIPEISDIRPATMIAEACSLADPYVDFRNYDWNGDGAVETVYVVYAGYAQSSGAPNTIWPHKSFLSAHAKRGDGPGALLMDGVTIDTYACSSELKGISGNTMRGIGTTCHEFSHCLGFPDMYDTSGNNAFGMGYWDLMNSGSYNGPTSNGEIPCGYSAYEKWTAGWIEPEELKDPCVVKDLPSIINEPKAYIMYNDNHRDEYFILENRQNNRWFSYYGNKKASHGLFITHVDYNKYYWDKNTVNTNKRHQRITFVPADNSYGETEAEINGDLFPGRFNVTSFTDESHSASAGNLFNMNTDGSIYLHKPIECISEKDGLISFFFKGGVELETPKNLKVKRITSSGFTATWDEVPNAEGYTLELSENVNKKNPLQNSIMSENFLKFKTSSQFDGFEDLSGVIDDYTIKRGWVGYKIFSSPQGVKLGTSSTNGYITTPVFSASENSITIKLLASAYLSDGAYMTIHLLNNNNISLSSKTIHVTNISDTYVLVFENINIGLPYKVSITSSDRIYLSDIGIFNDSYNLEDFTNYTTSTSLQIRKTINDITGTSYKFSNLETKKYKLRINATKYPAKSARTDYIEVELREPQNGDCNGDGEINIIDAKLIKDHYIGIKNDDFIMEKADINNDGTISISDANTIINLSK